MKVKLKESYQIQYQKFKNLSEEKRAQLLVSTCKDLTLGKTYEVVDISPKMGWYIIVDEGGEDYMYPPDMFDIVEE